MKPSFVCRSGTIEQLSEKKKLLQDVRDLRTDADERQRVLKLAKKAEAEAKKKAADLCLMAMRSSKAGARAVNSIKFEGPQYFGEGGQELTLSFLSDPTHGG